MIIPIRGVKINRTIINFFAGATLPLCTCMVCIEQQIMYLDKVTNQILSL